MQWTDLPCETANRLQVWMFGFAKTMVNLNGRTNVTFAFKGTLSCDDMRSITHTQILTDF